jgi:CRISPR-associated protein Csx17
MTEPIVLCGCAPEPLIHYLKALGVLRLVAEQLDPQVRGAWVGDAFTLRTTKTRQEIVAFFLNDYHPTPIVAPWNGGSGFYEGDDATGIEAISEIHSDRLESYRKEIQTILAWSEISQLRCLPLQEMRRQVLAAGRKSRGRARRDLVGSVRELKGLVRDFTERASNESKRLLSFTVEQLEQEAKRAAAPPGIAEGDFNKLRTKLLKSATKLRTKAKQLGRAAGKEELFRICRMRLDDRVVEWIDSAYVLGEEKPDFPPLLGSGGNDGRFDFTTNFMKRLLDVLPEAISFYAEKEINALPHQLEEKRAKAERKIEKKKAQSLEQSLRRLEASLFAASAARLEEAAVGQFHPAGAGGANAGEGVSGDSFVNPWDFILALEGSLLLASATVRQLAAGARTRSSFPFTVRNSNVGYGTAIGGENIRAELWLPLWSRLSGYAEVAHIFREGRVQFSRQRKAVRTGFDFARAVAELGVDRGIESFQRFAFIERNGQANLAAPLGRFEVRERPRAALLHQVDRWLDSFSRAASGDKVQPRFVHARQHIEDAIFRLCESGSADHLREVLISLGAAEAELARAEKFRSEKKLRPLSGLRLSWVGQCNDGSDEFRLATALASIFGEESGGSIRENMEPVVVTEKRVDWAVNSVRAIWGNGALEDNLAAVLHRRSIEARAHSLSHPILTSSRFASLKTITAFLNGETDDAKLEELLRGLALLDWPKAEQGSKPQTQVRDIPSALPRAYALLKLLFLPGGEFQRDHSGESITIKHEPAMVPLLRAGRLPDALQVAYQRLRAIGLVPATKNFHYDNSQGTRLAAALLIPIDEPSIRALAALVLRDKIEDE